MRTSPLVPLAACLAGLLAPLFADDTSGWVVDPPTGARARAGQELLDRAARIRPDAFEARHFQASNGLDLPYRLFRPAVAPGEKLPLVLFLHGGESRGTDNRKNLRQAVTRMWALSEIQEAHPCWVVVPQCREDSHWGNGTSDPAEPAVKMAEDPSLEMAALPELLDALQAEFPIDADRVYATGLSMGGRGTWELVARHPDRFAAALACCGRADPSTAPRLVDLPIQVFQGSQDRSCDPQFSRAMVQAVLDAGGTRIQYTEYRGIGHSVWNLAYSDRETIDWLFAQRRD